ncbi:hypothetical protein [Brevundimonas naejangsanensis]|uniref:hypothetical protein n=1 Tax=Brevundimonas naejangsanensis TaxID=588932 RepID=UPI0026F314EF|nr:hypothetical protein [Brevundimonas naejangsanensis]
MMILMEHPEQVEQTFKRGAALGFKPVPTMRRGLGTTGTAAALRLVALADAAPE